MIYVPVPSWYGSAAYLDDADLALNVDNAYALLNHITGRQLEYDAETNLEELLTWESYSPALANYVLYMVTEQGLREPPLTHARLRANRCWRALHVYRKHTPKPNWFGDEDLHAKHRELLTHHHGGIDFTYELKMEAWRKEL